MEKIDYEAKTLCYDCGAPYGEDGWCDVIVPDEIWNKIATDCGLLCFRCMTKRIESHGLSGVPVIIASGPYKDANEEWRLIGWQHGYDVAKNESDWIPVGVRLPAVTGHVLIFLNNSYPEGRVRSCFAEVKDGVVHWIRTEEWTRYTEEYPTDAVTHWRRFPIGPTGDTAA